MITLPTLIVTDGELSSGGPAGKAIGKEQDFLTLFAGALSEADVGGKGKPLTFADLQAANGRLQQHVVMEKGATSMANKPLAELLLSPDMLSAEVLAGLTDNAPQLLNSLTSALKTPGKAIPADKNTAELSDEELAGLNALLAMLPPSQNPLPIPEVADNGAMPVAIGMAGQGKNRAPELPTIPLAGQAESQHLNVTAHPQPSATPVVAGTALRAETETSPSPASPVVASALTNASASPVAEAVAGAGVLKAPLGSPQWQQTLGQNIVLFTRQGQQSAELRLHPEHLGQVHISLRLDDNQAQIQMVSPHSHVRAALEAALPVLRTQLAESGIQLGQSSISGESFAGQQQSSSRQQHTSSSSASASLNGDDDVALATPDSLQSAARGNSAVDIFA